MVRWRRLDSERIQRCGIFDLDRVRFQPPHAPDARSFWVIEAPDWINVIALTEDDRVLLLRQYRYGVEEVTLEIPGGMCDAGETPEQAAHRELREETGHACRELIPIGWVHPNPAVQTNRCHTFLARGAFRVGEPQPDPNEVLEQTTARLDEIPRLISEGRITHTLVLSAFHLLHVYRG